MPVLSTAFILLSQDISHIPWWNHPGWEAWKFFNLFIFVGLLIYILRRPLSESLATRREAVRRELIRAREERVAAETKLKEVEATLAHLNIEVETIRAQAQKEAAEEGERIVRATEEEMRKLREQAQREIESAGKAARQELRRYVAEQSTRLAEELIRRDIRAEDDARLMSEYVESLGGDGR
ncbi:MAG: F-type H+-transporting ATPase subunit b [Acidobacteriota bacterium]|nr:F-type H+-transporting ATPase subunit b [Acidobacteriota bacterium]